MPVQINDFEVVMEPPEAQAAADAVEEDRDEELASARLQAWKIESMLRRLHERRARAWAD
jgi:hypothetical protein